MASNTRTGTTRAVSGGEMVNLVHLQKSIIHFASRFLYPATRFSSDLGPFDVLPQSTSKIFSDSGCSDRERERALARQTTPFSATLITILFHFVC